MWSRLYPAVYRVAGVPETWRQALMAACLAWGDGVVVSHIAAAALWGLVGFEPGRIELSAPRMQRRARGHHVHHPIALARTDVTTLDGIPVTTVARTLIDLAGCVEPHLLEEALDDALRRGLVRVAQLRRRLDASGRAGRRGSRLLGEMIEVRAGNGRVPESVFETRLLRVLRAARLPMPSLQHAIGRYRVDFAYPERRVAIEADGFRWHSSRARWDRDIERRNALAVLGWTVIHVTWPQLQHRPEEVVDAVRATLAG